MPKFEKTFNVTTDENGTFAITQIINPPGPSWLGFTVEISAKLVSPSETTIDGVLDIDGNDGNPQNPSINFSISTVEQISLGKWQVDGGDNTISISAKTSPVRSNTSIEVYVTGTT